MTQIATQTTVTIRKATFDSSVIQLAKDILVDSDSDVYYFFQYSETDYVLLIPNGASVESVFGVNYQDVEVYQFSRITHKSTDSHSVSGNLIGSDTAHFQGDYDTTVVSDPVYYYSYYMLDSVSVSNPQGFLTYGSVKGLPKLVEKGVYYEAFQSYLLVGVCVFSLISRIFQRVI